MVHKCQLTVVDADAGMNVSVSGEFEDEEWERLEDFVQYAEDLLRTKFVQDGMHSSLHINYRAGEPMRFMATLPNWEDVEAFLHRSRPLILNDENTNFFHVRNTLSRRLADPSFRAMLDMLRWVYSGERMRSGFQVQVDEVIVNSERILNDWLNAYEYHRDKDKKRLIDSITGVFPLDPSKVLFIQLLAEKASAISALSAVCQVVLGKQQSLTTTGKRPKPAQAAIRLDGWRD